jgi:hypothetical protein
MSSESIFAQLRRDFHAALTEKTLTRNDKGVVSNADSSSKSSRDIASAILDQIGTPARQDKQPGQTAGALFETACADFVQTSLKHLAHLRPGQFVTLKGGDISQFEQYAHLDDLEAIARANPEIATALGSDYLIKPDITVSRVPETDARINIGAPLIDQSVARHASLRGAVQPMPLLHASISCKWTIRSDRAQNARSEGLNLTRNRKGRVPHVVVITGEPLPSRIASLALGTGDIDCVYHFALHELERALTDLGKNDTLDMLHMMIAGKRLKDISDLPLDLII